MQLLESQLNIVRLCRSLTPEQLVGVEQHILALLAVSNPDPPWHVEVPQEVPTEETSLRGDQPEAWD
jgi:hypothetical protein